MKLKPISLRKAGYNSKELHCVLCKIFLNFLQILFTELKQENPTVQRSVNASSQFLWLLGNMQSILQVIVLQVTL